MAAESFNLHTHFEKREGFFILMYTVGQAQVMLISSRREIKSPIRRQTEEGLKGDQQEC